MARISKRRGYVPIDWERFRPEALVAKTPYTKTVPKRCSPEREIQENVQNDDNTTDLLKEDLKILFVASNPDPPSTKKDHYFANSTSQFWRCLSISDLVDCEVTFKDDADLPYLYQLGFTYLTTSLVRNKLTLRDSEKNALKTRIKALRPRIVCFVGIKIYELYYDKECILTGHQEDHTIQWSNGDGETRIFVMPSTEQTEDRAYSEADKISLFQNLTVVANQFNDLYAEKH